MSESQRYQWCCEEGCGTCTPVQTPFEYSRTEDKDGRLLDSKSTMVWRSNCCGAELMLWDDVAQCFVEDAPEGPTEQYPAVG